MEMISVNVIFVASKVKTMNKVKAAVVIGATLDWSEYNLDRFIANEISEWEEIDEADIENIGKGLRLLDARPAVRGKGLTHKLIILCDKKHKMIEKALSAYAEVAKKEVKEKAEKEQKAKRAQAMQDMRKKRSALKLAIKALSDSDSVAPDVVSSMTQELELLEQSLKKK